MQSFTTHKPLGDSLSQYGNITFLVGDSPEELQAQLASLQIIFKIIHMYAQGRRHYAWIVPASKIKKVRKKTSKKGLENDSSKKT